MLKNIMLFVVLFFVVVLHGCAALPEGTSAIRVIEYGGSAGLLSPQGQIGGCSAYLSENVLGKNTVDVHFSYDGEKCYVEVETK